LLTVITLRKCINRVEYFRAGCRDVHREVSLRSPAAEGDSSLAILDREPTPFEAASLADTLEQLLRDYDAADRQVLELILQGNTIEEVSARLGRAERTVRRLRKRLKNRLERMQAEDLPRPAEEKN
jgi:RNA polymerase sigma-70 factor (ECF subfamily)